MGLYNNLGLKEPEDPLDNFSWRWQKNIEIYYMSDLQAIGKKYNTDKADVSHSYKGKTYCDVYNSYFKDIREEVKCVVEIGVLGGASLSMWREYFPNAQIWGIDIDPRTKSYESDRINILVGDQNDETFLQKVKETVGDIDILIDDGSHINRHIIHSYEVLKESVKRFYVVEDLCCSYELQNWYDIRKIWPGMKYNKENDDLKNYRHEIEDWFKKEVSEIDGKTSKWCSLHFHNWIMILQN